MSGQPTVVNDKSAASARDSRYEFILNTAASLIHERGYQAVSMRDLAHAVGIKMPSVYHHFESKEQILYAIARRTMVALIERTESVLNALASAPVPDRLAAALRVGVRFHIERQADAGVVLSEVRHLGGDYAADLRQLMKDYERIFYDLVVQGIEQGQFAPRDPTMATYIMLSALTRISIWYRPEGRLPAQAIEEEYCALLTRMLAEQPAPPARRSRK
ncbi:MAG: TetR/AcrR family transcriptional regulator [Hyphomicrobiales bacterium]